MNLPYISYLASRMRGRRRLPALGKGANKKTDYGTQLRKMPRKGPVRQQSPLAGGSVLEMAHRLLPRLETLLQIPRPGEATGTDPAVRIEKIILSLIAYLCLSKTGMRPVGGGWQAAEYTRMQKYVVTKIDQAYPVHRNPATKTPAINPAHNPALPKALILNSNTGDSKSRPGTNRTHSGRPYPYFDSPNRSISPCSALR